MKKKKEENTSLISCPQGTSLIDMCQNKSGWREDGVDLLVFSLSRFLSSTKPLSLLILFFSSVTPPFSDLSISVAPPSPIYLSRWLSSVIYLSSPFYLSRFLSSSNRFGLLSRIISSVTSLSLFGDLSLCGSLRGRRNPLSVALLKSKGKRVVWLFLHVLDYDCSWSDRMFYLFCLLILSPCGSH